MAKIAKIQGTVDHDFCPQKFLRVKKNFFFKIFYVLIFKAKGGFFMYICGWVVKKAFLWLKISIFGYFLTFWTEKYSFQAKTRGKQTKSTIIVEIVHKNNILCLLCLKHHFGPYLTLFKIMSYVSLKTRLFSKFRKTNMLKNFQRKHWIRITSS